jgi:hypothetical protein
MKPGLIFARPVSKIKPGLFASLLLAVFTLTAGTLAQTHDPQPALSDRRESNGPRTGQPGKDVIWLPTPDVLVETMLDMGGVSASDFLIDLGSGDGRVVIAAARRGAKALGVEYDRDLVAFSTRRAAGEGVSARATFVRADLFETDLSKATVITLFLRDDLNLKLRPKLLALRPGTRIVSNTFSMDDWEPDDLQVLSRGCAGWCTAMMWTIPARVEGSWRLPQGTIALRQHFQFITGEIRTGAAATPISDGRLRGDEITFTAAGTRYSGRVSDRTIEGTASMGSSTSRFVATRS